VSVIYHITTAGEWERARAAGEYTMSTRGTTLAEQGYIHCSSTGQVALVANAIYQGVPDLVVLVINTGLVRPQIRFELVPGSDEPFPHIYGPLNTDAVVQTRPYRPGANGRFSFPEAD